MEAMKVKILRNTLISGREASAGGIEQVTAKEARDLIAANKARYLDNRDTKPSVGALRGVHKGRSIAVLGGGPSLPADLLKIEHRNPVLIAVNHHAPLHHCPCDYMVFFDNPQKVPSLAKAATQVPVVVTPHGDHATHMLDIQYINYGMTAGLGVWLADLLGAKEIILCGMDCYTGGPTYFYDTDITYASDLKDQINCWKRVTEHTSAPVKAVSGPLLDIFKPFRPGRKHK